MDKRFTSFWGKRVPDTCNRVKAGISFAAYGADIFGYGNIICKCKSKISHNFGCMYSTSTKINLQGCDQ